MAKYNKDGTVDIEFDHPVYGLIPNTASPNNPDAEGAARWDAIMAGDYGVISPYVPPTSAEVLTAKRAAATMTPMEFKIAVDDAGYTPQIDALLTDVSTPSRIKIMWHNARSFERMHPDLISMMTVLGITDTQADAVFGIV